MNDLAGVRSYPDTRSCFRILIDEELPEGWDLDDDTKIDTYEASVVRANERWDATHPDCHHDEEKWANR